MLHRGVDVTLALLEPVWRRTVRGVRREAGAFVAAATLVAAGTTATGQVQRGSLEPSDVYEFAPPLEHQPRYLHDSDRPDLILNPDFFCSECAKEKRIRFQSREEMKDLLETDKAYNPPKDGKEVDHFGTFRMIEHEGATVLDYVFNKMKTRKPIFIEDKFFRLVTDFDGFSTREDVYPRREIELLQLADVFLTVNERTVGLNAHHRAHLYLNRAHRVLRDFEHIVRHDPDSGYMGLLGPYLGLRQKVEIYIFEKQPLMGQFLKTYLGHSSTLDGHCWHTLKDDGMQVIMHCDNMSDVYCNNSFTHRLSYVLMQGFRGFFYDLPAWFLIGFGHLMERRERTDFNTFFFGEGQLPRDFWGRQKWKMEVRKMVDAADTRPFVEIAEFTQPNELRPEEHGIIWSMVSYQMQLGQDKLGRFVHVLKEKQPGESTFNLQVRAFQTVYGITMTQFEENWKQWVRETYVPH